MIKKLLNKLLIAKLEENATDVNAFIRMVESGKLHNKICYGIAEDKRGFHIVDPIEAPGSLSAGGMGSGKSLANRFTLITRLITNSEHDFFILVDPLKGMTDYTCLFQYKANVVTALNNPAKLIPVIDMLHAECMARKDAFSAVGANNIYSYEKIMRQKDPNFRLARIIVCFEEFHAVPNSEYIKFSFKCDNPGTAAYQLKELMRISRSYGYSFHCASQRATPDDVPSTIKPGLTTLMAFRVNNPGDAAAMNLPNSADIRSDQRGRCAYEYGFMQFPYMDDNTANKLLTKYYKPFRAKMLKYTVQDFHTALEGEGNEGMVRIKPYKEILAQISQYNPLDVMTRFLEAFNFKVEKQPNSALSVQLIAEKHDVKYAVLIVTNRDQFNNAKSVIAFKEGAKILGCEKYIAITNQSTFGPSVTSELKADLAYAADAEDLNQISEVLDNYHKLELAGNYDKLFSKLVFAKEPKGVEKKDQLKSDSEDDNDDEELFGDLKKKLDLD
jgi:hypothetical protein